MSKRLLITLGFACLILCLFGVEVQLFSDNQKVENKRNLEKTLNEAAVHFYAVEGRFPPSLDYLCETYGIYYDPDIYSIFYEIFASNMMPDITVIDKEAQ